MNMTIQARRLVRRPRTGTRSSHGNIAEITCGIVSPTIMQKATIPPNALPLRQQSGFTVAYLGLEYPRKRGEAGTHNAHCAICTQH